jgi:hypothetical protein
MFQEIFDSGDFESRELDSSDFDSGECGSATTTPVDLDNRRCHHHLVIGNKYSVRPLSSKLLASLHTLR